MPQGQWSAKRERQYDHVKKGLLERGDPQDLAEEIAARTVNKERARSGEAGTLVWTTPSSAPDAAPVTGVPVTGA
jgi:hypothetical protein